MMGKYQFSDHERFAVFTVHGERCYICRKPLTFSETEIDHVIPEALLDDDVRRAEVLLLLGRPAGFGINAPENWLPTCRPCNNLKRQRIWDPSPLIQLHLQIASERKPKVEELIARQTSDREMNRALSTLTRAAEDGRLKPDLQPEVAALLLAQRAFRESPVRDEAISITPEFSVQVVHDRVRFIRTRLALLRRRALEAYGYRCAVTGAAPPVTLDIARITPLGTPSLPDVDTLQNFLVLTPSVHRCFDYGLIAIDPDSDLVLVSEELRETPYAAYHGQRAFLPEDPALRPEPARLAEHLRHARKPFLPPPPSG